MRVSKILGKKVLDSNANIVGKISDVEVNVESYEIEVVILNTGEISLRKNSYEITPKDISKIGDYVILNIEKSEIIPQKSSSKESDVKIVDPTDLDEEKWIENN